MPNFIHDDPYKRYKAKKVILQTSLIAKVLVVRRDQPTQSYLLIIAPTVIAYPEGNRCNDVKTNVKKLLTLCHPNIIRTYEAYLHNNYCYWLIEDWTCGHKRGLGSLTEEEVAMTTRRLVSALRYMHQNDFAHGNISWDDLHFFRTFGELDFKISDLGISKFVDSRRYHQYSTEGKYGQPPEGVEKGEYTHMGDMWTVGSVAFRLLTGDVGFRRLTNRFKNLDQDVEVTLKDFSKESKEFILACLKTNPEDRMCTGEALQHPWFDKFKSKESVKQPTSVLDALRNAERDNSFKRIACTVVARHVDHKFLLQYRHLFDAIDNDGSGFITHDELCHVLSDQNLSCQDVLTMFETIDTDKSGRISFMEFMATIVQFQKDKIDVEKLIEAFHTMDSDNDGYISALDLTNVLEVDLNEALWIIHQVVPEEIDMPKIDRSHFVSLFSTVDRYQSFKSLVANKSTSESLMSVMNRATHETKTKNEGGMNNYTQQTPNSWLQRMMPSF